MSEINLPPETQDQLFAYAQKTGKDPGQLVHLLVARFLEHEVVDERAGEWTDEMNDRRCALIDKEASNEISVEERIELISLQKHAEAHFDHVASPDLSTPSELLADLIAKANNADGTE